MSYRIIVKVYKLRAGESFDIVSLYFLEEHIYKLFKKKSLTFICQLGSKFEHNCYTPESLIAILCILQFINFTSKEN